MRPVEIKFLVILGISICLKQANAIDCYICGMTDSTCKDPFKTSGALTVPCTGSCYKIKETYLATTVKCTGNCYQGKAKYSSSTVQAAMRGCDPAVVADDKCANNTLYGYTGTVCYCRGNLCNYALPVGSSIIVMATAMIVYIVLR